jgi:predicted metal-dependent phosphoesterase TrpH
MGKLKVDVHTHCAEDPHDRIEHSAEQLIDEAAGKGFDALSITSHHIITYSRRLAKYAEQRDLVLIPGIEKGIEGKHVLLVNVDWRVHPVHTFAELRRWKNEDSLVIAPHPYYPKGHCLGNLLERNVDLFDAVEFSFFYSKLIDFNKRALRVAARHGLPVVGSSDCHKIGDLGTTYTVVECEKDLRAIVNAVRDGRVEVVSEPLGLTHMVVRSARSAVASVAEGVIEQVYGRLTGALVFESKALANRSRKEQRGI